MPKCATTSRKRPKLVPTLAALAGIALTLALGMWQLRRGHEKAELGARLARLAEEPAIEVPVAALEPRDVELRPVEAHGTFEPKYMVLLDNRVHRGVAGYDVVMPLKLAGGKRYVLVDRGWVAGGPDRSRLPQVNTPEGPVTVRGRAIVPGRRFLELSSRVAEGRVWQNLTIERYRAAMPIPIQPFLIQQDGGSATDDGLVREWAPPDIGVERHYGYAFQWFSLSAAILIFYVVTLVRRKPNA